MQFQKFQDFLKTRDLAESINKPALDFDRRLAQFNARFPDTDPKEVEKIIQASGWSSSKEFLNDKNERKWSKLKFGTDNWLKR